MAAVLAANDRIAAAAFRMTLRISTVRRILSISYNRPGDAIAPPPKMPFLWVDLDWPHLTWFLGQYLA